MVGDTCRGETLRERLNLWTSNATVSFTLHLGMSRAQASLSGRYYLEPNAQCKWYLPACLLASCCVLQALTLPSRQSPNACLSACIYAFCGGSQLCDIPHALCLEWNGEVLRRLLHCLWWDLLMDVLPTAQPIPGYRQDVTSLHLAHGQL